MTSFEQIVRETLRQKRKYHAKLLTDDAILITFDLSFDTIDLFAEDVWINVDLFTNISISLSLTYDIDLTEIEQLGLTFSIELPTYKEILQGISIKFEKFTLPEIGTVEDFIRLNIKEEYQEDMLKNKLRKGIYGVTQYGRCYYDPPDVRKFIANTIEKLFHKARSLEYFRNVVDGLKDVMGVKDSVARYIFERLLIIWSAQYRNFILGFGILGYSRLTPRASDEAELDFVNYEGVPIKMKYTTLDHVQCGFILGITPLGYGFLTPRCTVYKEPSPRFVWWIHDIAFNTIVRYPATAFGVANYNKAEERRDFRRSERADQYMSLQLMRYKIEELVENLLTDEKVSVTEIRQYKNAVLHLLSLRTKRHVWGYKPFKEMSDEELVRWWVDYWSRQGLKPSTLQKILEVIGRWLREWESQKLRLGKLVQLRRRMLARLL